MERDEKGVEKTKDEGLTRDINKIKEPKIFDVSENKYDYRDCWPNCSPCNPDGDCSPSVVCSPELRDCWPDCSPCNPNDSCRPDVANYHDGIDNCWPHCSPCSPDDLCSPDYNEGGK